jgi:hypothetical protein
MQAQGLLTLHSGQDKTERRLQSWEPWHSRVARLRSPLFSTHGTRKPDIRDFDEPCG